MNSRKHREEPSNQNPPQPGELRTHSQPPAGMVSAADLLAGAVMPVRLHLNVTVRPGSREELTRTGVREPSRTRKGLSLDARLGKHAPRILKWARRSTENANLLLVDPALAVQRAGVKLTPADQRALERHAAALSPSEVLPPGVELVGLNVKPASEPYAKRKNQGPQGADAQRRRTPKAKKRRKAKRGGLSE